MSNPETRTIPVREYTPLVTRRELSTIGLIMTGGVFTAWTSSSSASIFGRVANVLWLDLFLLTASALYITGRHFLSHFAVVPVRTVMRAEQDVPALQQDGPVPAGPVSVDAAVKTIDGILLDIAPGPEHVRACEPAENSVRWNTIYPRDTDNLPGERIDKMQEIRALVRTRLGKAMLLHRIPQIWLVADDGAVIAILEEIGSRKCGRLLPDSATSLVEEPA